MKTVLSSEIMRKSDKYTCENIISSRELMFKAGKKIFEAVKWSAPVAIVCGSGNNAGDGYVVASLMKQANIDCTIVLISDKRSLDGEYYFSVCKEHGVKINYLSEVNLSSFSTVIDCVFGIGFHGEVKEPEKSAIEAINFARKKGTYVVSADINSGLDSDSGLGELFVISDLTVSVGYLKSGHFLGKAKDAIKKLVNCDIGIEIVGEKYRLIEEVDLKRIFFERPNYSNKGDYGYVALIGGCVNYSGAAKLALYAFSAMRCGAGVAKLIVPEDIANAVVPYLLENTLCTLDGRNGMFVYDREKLDNALIGIRSVAVGMGIGKSEENAKIIEHLLKREDISLIIDADAINIIGESQMLLELLKKRSAPTLLTPHPKEFERLSKINVSDILKDPIYYAKKFAEEFGVTVLLKGTSSVICDEKDVFIVNKGCSGMATAGSGDVLSGMLAGISGYTKNITETAYGGAFIAGIAGEFAQKEQNSISMTARDTVSFIPSAINKIINSNNSPE